MSSQGLEQLMREGDINTNELLNQADKVLGECDYDKFIQSYDDDFQKQQEKIDFLKDYSNVSFGNSKNKEIVRFAQTKMKETYGQHFFDFVKNRSLNKDTEERFFLQRQRSQTARKSKVRSFSYKRVGPGEN
jgi:hypothetical protein